jgi:hypothetical protein
MVVPVMVVRVVSLVVCVDVKFPSRDSLPRIPLEVQMNLLAQSQCRNGIVENVLVDT